MPRDDDSQTGTTRRPPPKWIGPASEYAPLVVFFAVYWLAGLMAATKAVIAATLIAVAVSFLVTRRLPWMAVITAAIVTVFGGLTILLDDQTFIKMKPTIVQVLFAAVLLGALALGRLPLKTVIGGSLQMPDAAWRRLSLRFGLFFVLMAGLNEAVWRTQSTDVWVTFKVAGILGLTLLFVMTQVPFIARNAVDSSESDGASGDEPD